MIKNKIIDDGVIKFDDSNFRPSSKIPDKEYLELESWRNKLYLHSLIGEYPTQKIGYGNISERKNYLSLHDTNSKQFLISGTQTGGIENLTGEHYTRILDYDLLKQNIKCLGPMRASSESLTHASIYECNQKIQTVFHIHNHLIWKGMLKSGYDKTPRNIPYGTYEMALAVKKCIKSKSFGSIVMEGHEDGVIAYAANLEHCGEIIFDLYKKFII